MTLTIDLNADVGELPELMTSGAEEALLTQVSSASVACGGHAGDNTTMAATLALCARLGVAAGAHPGYPDRARFGRESLALAPEAIAAAVEQQLRSLAAVAARISVPLVHVKPHGALYNDAAGNPEVATAVALGVAAWRRDVILVARAGSSALEVYRRAGFAVAAEAFVERGYESDGSLRSRSLPAALIPEPARAAAQAVEIACRGRVRAVDGSDVALAADTLCLHGDSPGAAVTAHAVRAALERAGVRIAPLRGYS